MAQPLFDEHPLGQYLRDAGEVAEPMPGGTFEFSPQFDEQVQDDSSSEDGEPCLNMWRGLMQMLRSMISPHPSSAFVEKFKYNVISSSLLSPSLAPPNTLRAPRLPGHHSRNTSLESDEGHSHPHQSNHSLPPESQYYIILLAFSLVTILFAAGFYSMTALLIGTSAFILYILNPDATSKHDMNFLLDILNDLTAAGNVWDSVVQEAMTTIEKDEQSTSRTPSSPSSSLRVALHSTLLTTQTQCDDVRQLLSALASQPELSQLSEMYAPPSPMPSKLSFPSNSPTRPLSDPSASSLYHRRRTTSVPTAVNMDNKRATWNGSYSYLANAGTLTMQYTKRREKRRSDLSALLEVTAGTPSKSFSAPVTPVGEENGQLEGVSEEETVREPSDADRGSAAGGETGDTVDEEQYQPFGPAALRLRRVRTIGGLDALRVSSSSSHSHPDPHSRSHSHSQSVHNTHTPPSAHSLTNFPTRSRSQSPWSPQFATLPIRPSSSSSKFTSMQAPRHPLSFSSLHLALQNALASKRYACSHLLALRFAEEGDDEAYWEDVQSVMGLLTTALVDASARLTDALDRLEKKRLEDGNPSPPASAFAPRGSFPLKKSDEMVFGETRRSSLLSGRGRTKGQSMSFAPMPSHLSRFAAHVEAISSALDDAREQLEECVAVLKSGASGDGNEGEDAPEGQQTGEPSSSFNEPPASEKHDHPALQAYERLRRELGLALRECERGRERLLDVVSPPRPPSDFEDDELSFEDQEHAHDLPALSDSSNSSGRRDSAISPLEYPDAIDHDPVAIVNAIDDVTAHLLLTSTSQHLPPLGIEQVYEGDTDIGGVGAFKRERSKLSREERIRLAKKAKEEVNLARSQHRSRIGVDDDESSDPSREQWGPGGEVVQELKDVIWKVGEKRRKLADGQVHNVVPQPLLSSESDSETPTRTPHVVESS